MPTDTNISGRVQEPQPIGNSPTVTAPEGPPAGVPPPLIPSPPPLPTRQPWLRPFLSILLSVCLGLFLADGLFSVLDNSLALGFGTHLLAGMRGTISFCAFFVGMLVYATMGLTPAIPKRVFLPLSLFSPAALLAFLPISIYFYRGVQRIGLVVSLFQVLLGLGVLFWLAGGLRFRWPLVKEPALKTKLFSWGNLAGFLLVNIFVLLPLVALSISPSARAWLSIISAMDSLPCGGTG